MKIDLDKIPSIDDDAFGRKYTAFKKGLLSSESDDRRVFLKLAFIEQMAKALSSEIDDYVRDFDIPNTRNVLFYKNLSAMKGLSDQLKNLGSCWPLECLLQEVAKHGDDDRERFQRMFSIKNAKAKTGLELLEQFNGESA